MDRAPSLSDGATLEGEDTGRHRRHRRRRRHRTLGEKLRRNHAVQRAKRTVMVIVLGLAVIATAMYVARNSTAYEPVPEPVHAPQ